MTNNNFKNNKTKTTTAIISTLMIGLVLLSPTMAIPNINATSTSKHIAYAPPTLLPSETLAISNVALSIPELQNWSHNWQYVDTGFLGNNKVGTPDFKWQYAIVDLKASSSSAPVSCDQDWWAWVEVDMTTMKVVRATYPTAESHPCEFSTALTDSKHTWSTTTQDNVNSTLHSYYGIYAELNLPSYNTNIYHDLKGWYIEQLVNAFFPNGTANGCNIKSPEIGCIEQTGWVITNGTFGCIGCPNHGGEKDLVYVDESNFGNPSNHYTGLVWTASATTLYGEIDCAYGVPDYGITASNGTNQVTKTTKIPCSLPQWDTSPPRNGVVNNSVFFENADKNPSSNWSGDVTGTVSATNALEYKDSYSGTPVAFTASNKVNTSCTSVDSISNVITGSLASGGTATWSSLSNQPVAC